MELPKRISINLSETKYKVVHTAAKSLGWKVSQNQEDVTSDVFWQDSGVIPEKLASLKLYQKINHFPGMGAISRKDSLARNVGRMRALFPNDFNFIPRTWILPADMATMRAQLKSTKTALIVKPKASSQGKGIYLVRSPEEIESGKQCVVQEYISNPLLIDGLKFDLRMYVLVTGVNPLRIFVHEDGLARFATQMYEKPDFYNINDRFMHLTNYAVNRTSHNYSMTSKQPLDFVWSYLRNRNQDIDLLKEKIYDAVIKTLCAIQPKLSSMYTTCQWSDLSNSMCFELLGIDIILDEDYNPFLLEVNHSPSFSIGSNVDNEVKLRVITDTLQLLNVQENNRKQFFEKYQRDMQRRTLTGKAQRLSRVERTQRCLAIATERDKFEAGNLGGFTKIFHRESDEDGSKPGAVPDYEKYIISAEQCWETLTGGYKTRYARLQRVDPPAKLIKTPPPETHETPVPATHGSKSATPGVFSRLAKVGSMLREAQPRGLMSDNLSSPQLPYFVEHRRTLNPYYPPPKSRERMMRHRITMVQVESAPSAESGSEPQRKLRLPAQKALKQILNVRPKFEYHPKMRFSNPRLKKSSTNPTLKL